MIFVTTRFTFKITTILFAFQCQLLHFRKLPYFTSEKFRTGTPKYIFWWKRGRRKTYLLQFISFVKPVAYNRNVPNSRPRTLATSSGFQTKFCASSCSEESRTSVDVTYFSSQVSQPNIATSNKKHFIHTRVKLWQSSQHLPHLSATLVHQSTVKPHCYDIALYGTFILTIKSLLQLCSVQNMSSRKCFDIFLKINNIFIY